MQHCPFYSIFKWGLAAEKLLSELRKFCLAVVDGFWLTSSYLLITVADLWEGLLLLNLALSFSE